MSVTLPADPLLAQQWSLLAGPGGIDIARVWAEYRGTGVTIAVLDDGIDPLHPDFAGQVDWSLSRSSIYDDQQGAPELATDGHGTAVASILAAAADGQGMVGVAHGATLISLATSYDGPYTGTDTLLFRHAALHADVLNNSFGFLRGFGADFTKESERFVGESFTTLAMTGRGGLGTVAVNAAGNRGDTKSTSADNFTNSRFVITVGATDIDGRITDYSVRGASVFVSAPGGTDDDGLLVAARVESGEPLHVSDASGTSFAAPIVSGVVALMLEANPLLGYRDVQDILARSARLTDATDAGWAINGAAGWNGGGMHFSHAYGFGMVDPHAAVRLAEVWTRLSTAHNAERLQAGWTGSVAIPDGEADGVSTSVTVADDLVVQHVELRMDIAHGKIGDLEISLTSPDGTVSTLVSRISPEREDGILLFTFGSVAHWGEDAAGTWTVTVRDLASGTAGTVRGWTLTLHGDVTADDDYVYTDAFSQYGAEAARRVLADADGGADRLNAAALTGDLRLDIGAGRTSMIAGQAVRIASGTAIEHAAGGDGNDRIAGNTLANGLIGGRGADTVLGGAGDDTLEGDAGADRLDAGAGTDSLDGGAGNDTLFGRDNVDLMSGGAGADRLDGGDGEDDMLGDEGADTLLGGLASDVLLGGADDDLIDAGEGHDNLAGGSGNDLLLGRAGQDEIEAGSGNDTLDGASGRDTLNAGRGDDLLRGGDDRDILYGETGFDTLSGGAGNDDLYGGEDADSLSGGDGDDYMMGGDGFGNDILLGGAGDDIMTGMLGADTLSGGAGDDEMYGGSGDGADSLTGGAGADTIHAWEGADTLRGGDGDDQLFGAAGNDVLQGGAGFDEFYYFSGGGLDRIADFVSGEDAILFGLPGLPAIDGELLALPEEHFVAGRSATLAIAQLLYDETTGILRFDEDGTGAGVAVMILRLGAGTALSVDDVFI